MSSTTPSATLKAIHPAAAPDPVVDQRGHVVELQSLRGLASLLVVGGHTTGYYATPSWYDQPRNLANGHAAVVLFFILSGYVLTLSLERKALNLETVAEFYWKRLFRIYPALWASSLIGLAYLVFLHYRVPVPDISPWFADRFKAGRMTPLHITASFAAMLAFVLPQIWTIFTELAASVLMPFLGFMVFRRRKLFWAAAAVALLVSLGVGERTYYAVGVYIVDFFVGASLCILGPRVQAWLARATTPRGWLAAGCTAVLIGFHAWIPGDYNNPWIQIVEAGSAAGLIALFVYGGLQAPVLLWRPTRVLGDISYSLYLVHFPIMCLLAKGLQLAAPGVEPAIGGIWAGALLFAATTLLSLPAAWASYHYVELPGVRLGKRLWRRAPVAQAA